MYYLPLLFLGAVVVYWWRQKKPKPAAVVPFEWRYPLDLARKDVVETEANVADGVVEEVTPEGVVVLRYDRGANLYEYWAAKAITYKYLEAVARKYAIVYDARDNYVNLFRELLRVMNEDKPAEKPADPLFAQFKSYAPKPKGLVKKNANAYKWRGTLQDMKKTEEPKLTLSYAEFKKKS